MRNGDSVKSTRSFLERERRRLRRSLHAILVGVGTPWVAVACTPADPPKASRDAGARPRADATMDAPSSDVSPFEAGLDGCTAAEFQDDAAPPMEGGLDTCGFVFTCGLRGSGLVNQGCTVLLGADGGGMPVPGETCWLADDAGCEHDAFAPGPGGSLTVLCTPCPGVGGRRPAGLVPRGSTKSRDRVGAYLAALAFEEDAAVLAFERMTRELASLGAPRSLVRASARAAADERRHVRIMAKLAEARGASVTRAGLGRRGWRGAAAIAVENAAEGCVRETYGALVAMWQSTNARDATLRAAFVRIAADEARHAALSWAVASWLEPRLDAPTKRRIARARASALETLKATVDMEPSSELVLSLGLPTRGAARALLAGMTTELGLAA